MSMIGHNSRVSLSAAAQANLETGVLLLCKEALITAIQDRRLERGHLRVLAAIATCINSRTAKAWPNRATIAAMTGMSLHSVSNTLLELRNFGYLIAEREAVEEANGRRLTVYTFGNIDHDCIRREITEFVTKLRTQREGDEEQKSPQAVKSEDVPAGGESPPTRGPIRSPQAVNSAEKVPAGGGRKSPQAVDSNSIKEPREREPARSIRNSAPHMGSDGFVISAEHNLLIPMEVIDGWRLRFPAIPDLEAQMQKLASVILSRGIMHPGWNCPDAWMAGCLAKDNQRSADDARLADARLAGARRGQPTKTFQR